MRADWRFLVPWDEERAPTIRLDPGRPEPWMEDDGWAVTTGPADIVATTGRVGSLATEAIQPARGGPSRRIAWVDRRGSGLDELPDGHRRRHYLPVPRSGPRTYLPLDHRPAIRWWLNQRLGPRLGAASRPMAAVVARVGRRLPGTVAVTTGPDVGPWPPPVTDVVVTTSGHDEGSRVVRLMTGDDGRPQWVEKLANRPRYESETEHEQATLGQVGRQLPPDLAEAVPRALGLDRVAGIVRGRESHCDGPTMAQAVGRLTPRARAEAALERAAAWLVEADRATARSGTWAESESEEFLRSPLAELETFAGRPLDEVRLLAERAAERADGTSMARSFRHYDLGPWNLIIGERLGVVDWELEPPRPADRIGLAGADLLYLATYWRHLVVGARSAADERAVSGFATPSTRRGRWAGRASRAIVERSFRSTGLDLDALPAIWVHNWLEQAVFTANRRPDGDPGPALGYLELAASNPAPLLDR